MSEQHTGEGSQNQEPSNNTDDDNAANGDVFGGDNDYVADGFDVGNVVHNKSYPATSGNPGDSYVLARHDDDTVTVGRFASIERVATDDLNAGASSTFESTEQ